MCGTDYNKNIKKVGPKTSYNYIREYKTIEGVNDNTKHDITILRHNRVRELFRDYQRQEVKVRYCGQPCFNSLHRFLIINNIHADMDRLEQAFLHNTNIVFVEEDVEEERNTDENDDSFPIEVLQQN
jgi:5'-3' exonuclease